MRGPERREESEKSLSAHGQKASLRKSLSKRYLAGKRLHAHTGGAAGNCDLAEHLNPPWP